MSYNRQTWLLDTLLGESKAYDENYVILPASGGYGHAREILHMHNGQPHVIPGLTFQVWLMDHQSGVETAQLYEDWP